MKILTFTFLCILAVNLSHSQSQKKIIFQFNSESDRYVKNKEKSLYVLKDKHSFKVKSKNTKKINFQDIKNEIISYEEFSRMNKNKKFPDYFNEYSFFLYKPQNDTCGFLIKVEKVWTVEEKTVN